MGDEQGDEQRRSIAVKNNKGRSVDEVSFSFLNLVKFVPLFIVE